MANLPEEAINCSDGDRAAKIIQDALGMESDDFANYCFPEKADTRAAHPHHGRMAADRGPHGSARLLHCRDDLTEVLVIILHCECRR
jgi:hypothetical protein